MRRSVNVIKRLLEECASEEQDQWKSHAQTVLAAVRDSHPTQRGLRTAIAAGFFENSALPAAIEAGWTSTSSAHRPDGFRFSIERNGFVARILIGLLQMEAGKPVRRISEENAPGYLAQLPKKPASVRIVKSAGKTRNTGTKQSPEARGWLSSDFDILAVSMYPVTRAWSDFRFTLSGRLRPSPSNDASVEQLQPVPPQADGTWTGDLPTCLGWLTADCQDSRRLSERIS